MKHSTKQIARALGARVVGRVPEAGGGAFGAARLALIVASLRERLEPASGRRPGRPTSKDWVLRSKVPMSERTRAQLDRLARQMSTDERKVSPMQVAAQLLEDALAGSPEK